MEGDRGGGERGERERGGEKRRGWTQEMRQRNRVQGCGRAKDSEGEKDRL